MLLDKLGKKEKGLEFKTEKEYPDRKGWFADLVIEDGDVRKA